MISIEILRVVALLCQVNVGSMNVTVDKVREEQIRCHKYYAACLESKKELLLCIKDR
jgi:hypothetical protein